MAKAGKKAAISSSDLTMARGLCSEVILRSFVSILVSAMVNEAGVNPRMLLNYHSMAWSQMYLVWHRLVCESGAS